MPATAVLNSSPLVVTLIAGNGGEVIAENLD
jgi:hypothetical protein